MRRTKACRPHSGLAVGGGQGTRRLRTTTSGMRPEPGRVSGLTKAAKAGSGVRVPANHRSNAGLAGLARGSRIPTSGAGSGPSSSPWKRKTRGPACASHHHGNQSLWGAEHRATCSETSGLLWSAQGHYDNRDVDEQAGPVGGVGAVLATLVGPVMSPGGKGVLVLD